MLRRLTVQPSAPASGFSTKSLVLASASTQYVTFGDNLDIERTDTVSISMWVKFTDVTTAQMLYSKQDSNSPYRGPFLELTNSGTTVIFQLNNTDATNAIDRRFNSLSLDDDTWYHFVVTYAGDSAATGVKFYIDGVEKAGTTQTDNLNATTINAIDANIGGYANGAALKFDGQMDEISWWTVTLSESDVTTIYNAGEPDDLSLNGISGLAHWWRCEDDLTDSEGSLDGTGVNSPTYSTDVP